MATDLERLTVSLEASTVKYERAMQKALGVTNSTMQRIERRNASAMQRMGNGFAGLQRGIATAFAGAAALRGAQQLIDASTRIENSLKVVGLAGEELDRVYDQLFASAQRNMAPLESLTTLYSRLGLAQKELGATNDELISFTDNVALALRVQGTNAQEARGALIQLSQAMGSGIVRAEEFNSVVEGAPSILRAAAAGLVEAEGSVAKLRALVVDGKVSSQAFFQAFQAGAGILRDQVAGAEVTVSQGFVRLQNVLIDTAGKFDNATGASRGLAGMLSDLGDNIEELANSNSFKDFSESLSGSVGETLQGNKAAAAEVREAIKQIGIALEGAFENTDVSDLDLALAEAEQALATFALNAKGQFGELDPVVQDFIQQLLEGRGTAESAAEAIDAIGEAGDFGGLLGKLSGLVDGLFAVRSEAVATAAAVAAAARGDTAGTNIEGQRAEQLANRPSPAVQPVSLSDYPIVGGSGGGGGKQSPGERFAAALASQQQRIDALNRETELMRQLNPLVNDYGFAVERLKAQIELENAAKEAGLPLDETRMRQIDELAAGYGRATAEAARLADAQDLARQTADDLANAGREALDTIIDGFLEGKDAGEIFNSVLKDLAKNLLNIGLNSISGGLSAGGFNPLGFLGGLFGFASGTANTGGQRGQARGVVHGQEAVIPLPSGGKVPVDLRIPSLAAASAAPQQLMVHVVSDDEKFGAYVTDRAGQVVAQASPSLVASSVTQANKSAPASVAKYQRDVAGGDYRL